MSVRPLTAKERERFAAWLEEDARADTEIIDRLSAIDQTYDRFVVERRIENGAKMVVAKYLRSIESVDV